MKKVARRMQQVKWSIFGTDRVVVYHGDCLNVMASMPEASVDTIVTDPPYHLTQASRGGSPRKQDNGPAGRHHVGEGGFMGKTWDGGSIAFSPETWRAALRVAKPGAHLLAFGGTRTFHRLACAIEDAGWEVRDCLMWVYGSGFPKSLDVSKAIDKAKGMDREKVGEAYKVPNARVVNPHFVNAAEQRGDGNKSIKYQHTTPATPEAARWQGWGTTLKPAWEPIILARKPLDGTVAECALRHGTGALNVDGCRIESIENPTIKRRTYGHTTNTEKAVDSETRGALRDRSDPIAKAAPHPSDNLGRWPANAVFQHDARCVRIGERSVTTGKAVKHRSSGKMFGGGSKNPPMPDQTYGDSSGRESVELWACIPGCPVRMLDEQSGTRTSGSRRAGARKGSSNYSGPWSDDGGPAIEGSSGVASRFFYTPKASTAERILGCPPGYENRHPTVKPLDLCRWLCRLTKSPDGGVVLDPFSGSGSIAVAALLEDRRAVAIELEEESANVTVARVQAALKYGEGLQNLKRYKLKGRKKLKRRR